MKRSVVPLATAALLWLALFTGTSAGAALAHAPAAARSAVAGGTWGNAKEVPGIAALNTGGFSAVNSVSCGAAGNCAAGGFFQGNSGMQAFVADETNGTWGTAQTLSGITGNEVSSVSCASAGNCSAGGRAPAFVVDETNGSWGTARTLSVSGITGNEVSSVSCASAGNCSAGGDYTDSSGHTQVLVAGETNGTWGTAEQVPGTAALNQGGDAVILSVSCASAGNCSAGGRYTDSAHRSQAFVVNETNGTWGTAEEVPGTAALNQGTFAWVVSVSCGAAGTCGAGGQYTDSAGHRQAFVVSEAHGIWGTAREVPGTAALNQGGSAGVSSVSCPSAGNCSAGGGYTDSAGHGQAFVVNETNGTWGTALEVPGTAALNLGGGAATVALSCPSAGNCSAGGDYRDNSGLHGHIQAFVVGETSGTWGTAEQVPGTAALNRGGDAQIYSVSCATVDHCSAGGFYAASRLFLQPFVVKET